MIRIELVKAIISYFTMSLAFLILFSSGTLDLETANKYKKYKNIIIVFFCLFWPGFIFILLNTLLNGGDRR